MENKKQIICIIVTILISLFILFKPYNYFFEKILDSTYHVKESEKYNYTFDFYRLSSSYAEILGQDDIEAYNCMINAYLNYQTSCKINLKGIANLWAMLDANFPIFWADVAFDSAIYNYSTKTYTWKYTTTSEEHLKIINDFKNTIAGYMANIKKGDSEATITLILYEELTKRSTYSYDVVDTLANDEIDTYDALTENIGVCGSFARAYMFLLNQVGIDAIDVFGTSYNADGSWKDNHSWTLLKIDGKYYYADPTWDIGGNTIDYFGMTAAYRESELGGGYSAKESSIFGNGDYITTKYFDISDTRFQTLWNNGIEIDYNYFIDQTKQQVFYIKSTNSSIKIIKLNTNSL